MLRRRMLYIYNRNNPQRNSSGAAAMTVSQQEISGDHTKQTRYSLAIQMLLTLCGFLCALLLWHDLRLAFSSVV